MKHLISVILFIVLISSCEQKKDCSYIYDYYQNIYLAEQAYYQENYQLVVDLMDKACINCEVLNQSETSELYNYAESAARIGDHAKAITLVKKLVLSGYNIEQLANNEGFAPLIKTKEWQELEASYNELHQEYLNGINLDLRQKIAEMIQADQYHRRMVNIPGMNADSIWVLINRTDSLNDLQLKKIIAEYGYPNERIIGGFNIDQQQINPGILLFHFHDYDYYTKVLKQQIDEGKAPPKSLGNFVDSYQRREKKRQRFIYGIYDNVKEDEIIDYENLDDRRISIGLPPMELKRNIDSLKKVYYGL
jgi:hypothetical protein